MLRWNPASCKRLLLLLFFFAFGKTAIGKPFFRDWWLNETNTPVRVNDIAQDADGYLWLATEGGFFRFNGTSFYLLPATRGQEVTSLSLGDSGVVAGFRSGKIAAIRGNQIRFFSYKGQQADAAITQFAQAGNFRAFGTLGSGLWCLGKDSARVLNASGVLRDDYVYGVQILSPNNGLLLATDRGVDFLKKRDGKVQSIPLLEEGIMRVLKPVPGFPGRYIAGSQEGIWYDIQLRDGSAPAIAKYQVSSAIAEVIFMDGRMLLFTEDGKVRCYSQAGKNAPYIAIDSFETGGRGVRKAFADRNGNLWLATSAGLSQCTHSYLRQSMLPAPFSLSAVTALAHGDGHIWYTQESQLLGFNLQSQQTDIRCNLPASITSLSADGRGLWIGTLGSGLLFRAWGKESTVSRPLGMEAFAQEHVLDVTAHEKKLWMATLNGVEEMEILTHVVKPLRRHTKKNGLGADYVYQMLADAGGNVWMATDGGGVWRYDDAHYYHVGQQNFSEATVYSLAQDKQGFLWAASLEKGLSVFDGENWRDLNAQQGLQSARTSAVAALGNGDIVVAHDRGADIWMARLRQFRHINRRLGMDIDSSTSRLNCITTDDAGNVWLPFEHGLLQIVATPQEGADRPGLSIHGVSLFGSALLENKTAFTPDENSLTFHYEGINLLNPEKLQYRYRLEGLTKEWAYTRDEMVPFSRLRPGDYRFVLEASYSPSFENAVQRTYSFSIAPPLWNRLWFIGLLLAALAGLVLLAVRIRERNIRRLATLQKARVEAEYQHLKTQVNPHFLFNSLNILTTLIRRDKDRAVEYTLALSDLYRNTLQHSDKDRIPLSEEWEILRQYLLVQQTRFGTALQLQKDIPDAVFADAFIVPLTLQMLVENAIKHNVVSTTQPLLISIGVSGEMLVIRNTYQPRPKPEKGTGIGLKNIQSRYRILGHHISYGMEGNSFVVELPLL